MPRTPPTTRAAARRRDDVSPSPASTMASWPATIIRALDAHGRDGRRIAAAAGIDPTALADPEGRVPSLAVMRFLARAVEETGDPAFALTVARFVQPTTFYALGYAMVASRTLREALERACRYRRVIGDLLQLGLEPRRDGYRLLVSFGTAPAPAAAIDTAVAIAIRTIRMLCGDRGVNPVAVHLRRPRPPRVDPYQRAFRAPIAFDAAETVIVLDRGLVERPLPAGHGRLAQQSEEAIVRYLAALDCGPVSRRVQEILVDRLPSGAPSKASVARELRCSARTLQRHLQREGRTFAALLRATRLDLARAFIAEGRLSVKQMTFLLGFSSRSAFSRAFKGWTGSAPTAGDRTGKRRRGSRRA